MSVLTHSRPSPKTFTMGLVLLPVFFSVYPSAAEMSGPLTAATLDSTISRYSPQTQVAGSFKVHGSETMYPLLNRLSLEFQRRQPKVTIDIKGGGSTKAIAEFLQPPLSRTGKVMLWEERVSHLTLVAASRELSGAEIKEFAAQNGYEPTTVAVAVDAVALYVHKDNPLSGLTLEQVDAMFSTTRNRGYRTAIKSWGDVGLGDGLNTASIQLYGRDRKSGTRAFFQEHCLSGGEFVSGVREDPGAASVILDVSRDQVGIGYSGLGLQSSSVRMVPLAERAGTRYVMPSFSTVADQTYPLRRVLYLYVNKSPKEPLPAAAQEFLSFVTSYEGQQAVMRAGFFPLPSAEASNSAVAQGLSTAPKATTIR